MVAASEVKNTSEMRRLDEKTWRILLGKHRVSQRQPVIFSRRVLMVLA
jgi:hypothetical protein